MFRVPGGMGRRRSLASEVCPWCHANARSHGQNPTLVGRVLPMPHGQAHWVSGLPGVSYADGARTPPLGYSSNCLFYKE